MTKILAKEYGLLGYPLGHSFSKKYFAEKFIREGLAHHSYEHFPLENINDLPILLRKQPNLRGLNVTIPHKQSIIPLLDEMDEEAAAIGAVNVVKIERGKLTGYNSDVFGFEVSLRKFLGEALAQNAGLQALVLGTGGASRAVVFVLGKMKIPHDLVSRREKPGQLTYQNLTPGTIAQHRLIINCTPLGTHPDVGNCPALPYEAVGPGHFCYDLVYNPAETLFLQKAKARSANTLNGLDMLHLQAERAWEIWK